MKPCRVDLALGLLADRVDVLEAAAAYLFEHGRLSIEPERMSMVRGV